MTVRVLFFSVLKDISGTDEMETMLREGATVKELLDDLFTIMPKLKAWDASLLIAVDQTYVKRDAPLHDLAEIAIMPPVQGG